MDESALSPGPVPPFHLVTDAPVLSRPDFTAAAAEALAAGGNALALHLRGPGMEGGVLFRLARDLLPAARRSGALLLVNDRLDVAAASGAHGAHLGRRSLPVQEARRLMGPSALLGASVHSAEEARDSAGADFLLVGNVFATASHPGRPGAGTALLERVAGVAPGVPLIAIGGVLHPRVPSLREAGAAGFAVLSGVWDERTPASAVERYLTAWQNPNSNQRETQR